MHIKIIRLKKMKKKKLSFWDCIVIIGVIFLILALISNWETIEKEEVVQIFGIISGLLLSGYIIKIIQINSVKKLVFINNIVKQ